MGPSDGNFDAVLERAISELLSVPVVEGEVALEPHGTVYGFAEPRLQEMSAAQKQFLRMGPQNATYRAGQAARDRPRCRHSGNEIAAGRSRGGLVVALTSTASTSRRTAHSPGVRPDAACTTETIARRN